MTQPKNIIMPKMQVDPKVALWDLWDKETDSVASQYDSWPEWGEINNNEGSILNRSRQLPPRVVQLQYNPIAVIMNLKSNASVEENTYSKKNFEQSIPSKYEIQLGEEIVEYYLNKLVCLRLSNQYTSSPYRRNLASALTLAKQHAIKGDHVRLLCRLIDFYEEDSAIDQLCDRFKSYPKIFDDEIRGLDLSFCKKITVKRRSHTRFNYFFADTDNNKNLYCLKNDANDALEPFLDLVVNNGPIRVSGHVRRIEKFHDHNFYYASMVIKKIHTL